jgi:hypothetical protein
MFIGDDLGVDLDFFLEEFREGFESGAGSTLTPVDSWESGTSLHSMDLMELDDVEFAIYSTIEEGRLGSGPVLMLFGMLPDAFERSFETLQEEVTLNGDPVFADDDAESLASILDGGTATSSSSSDRSSGRSSRSNSNTSSETSRQSGRSSQGSAYRDSEYGYTVDYSSPWSPASPAAGSLTLQDSSFNTVGFMGMPFFGSRTAFIDIMESSWQGSGGVYLGTVETDDRILMVTEVPGGGILAQEIIFMDSTTAVVVSVVLIGDTAAAVRSLQQNVSVNDEPVLRDWNDL